MPSYLALTVVPRGKIRGDQLLFSVQVRLQVDKVQDWPHRLERLQSEAALEFYTGPHWERMKMTLTNFKAAEAKEEWDKLFKPLLPNPAIAEDEPPPSVPKDFQALNEYEGHGELRKQLRSQLTAMLFAHAADAPVEPVFIDQRSTIVKQLNRLRTTASPGSATADDDIPKIDTAQKLLGVLSDSPTMLRKLGLVFDLVAPSPGPANATRVRVDKAWALLLSGENDPRKLPLLETEIKEYFQRAYYPARFSGADRTATLQPVFGALAVAKGVALDSWAPEYTEKLSDDAYGTTVGVRPTFFKLTDYEIDCDSDPIRGALKSVQRGPARVRLRSTPLQTEESVGIFGLKKHSDVLLKYSVARQLVLDKLTRNPEAATALERRLDILDLIQGYRPYVKANRDPQKRKWGPWSSLCGSSVSFRGAPVSEGEDGCIDFSAVEVPGDPQQGSCSDVLFAWRNWPLCVPPVFQSLLPDPERSKPAQEVGLTRGVSAAYRIPPLRFGWHYSFSLHPVSITGDLIGHAPSRDNPSEFKTMMCRSDPVGIPDILHPRHRRLTAEQREADSKRLDHRPDEIVLKPDSDDDDRGRWLMAPVVGAELYEFAGGLDNSSRTAFAWDARRRLADTDLDPNRPGPDNLLNRLSDPAACGLLLEVPGELKPLSVKFKKAAVFVQARTGAPPSPIVVNNDSEYPSVSIFVPRGEERVIKVRTLIDELAFPHFRIVHEATQIVERFRNQAYQSRLPVVEAAIQSNPKLRAISPYLDAMQPCVELRIMRPTAEPVVAPVIESPEVVRNLGETSAKFELKLNFHRGSVEQLELHGSWVDITDGEKKRSEDHRTEKLDTVTLKAETRTCDAPQLRHAVHDEGKYTFSHAFKDGRHRIIDLRVRAIVPERYARALDVPAGFKDSATFRVYVPNVVVPKPIEVEEIVPITRVLRRKRKRDQFWGVRIYMRHGFMESGPDEEVVILEQAFATNGPSGSPEIPASRFVTTIGADALAGALASNAFKPRLIGTTQDDRERAPLKLAHEGFKRVIARRFKPRRTPSGKWFVDVRIDNCDYYFPFVRLVIARYQRNSVAGAEVSVPTELEFIPIPPRRSVTGWRKGSNAHFIVHGKFRTDTKLTASLLVRARDDVDYASEPDHPDLLLDETGLWEPVIDGEKPRVVELARDDAKNSFYGKIRVPRTGKRWRVMLEEKETYLDTALHPTSRTIWFAQYDNIRGFTA